MKKKRGFTLAEILGVIVIVGMLMILVTPGIINKLRSNRDNVEAAGNEIIYSAANQYISENKKTYKEGKQYCISIQKLVADGKLVSPVINVVTGENVEEKYVLAQIQKSGSMNFYITDKDSCEESTLLPLIQFSLSPTLKEKTWSTKRTVTIIYPANGEEHKYAITSSENEPAENDWQDVESLSNNKTTVDFIENGYIHAKMKYENGSETKSRMPVGNVDAVAPEIESTCTAASASITIKDSVSGVKEYKIFEDDVQKVSKTITARQKVTLTHNLTTGKIYKVTAKDAAGNEAESVLCIDNPVKVTFDPNGGTVSPTVKIYDGGKKYNETPGGEFPTPTRTGYTFNGWYTDGGSKVYQTTTVPNNDHTLHAHWTAKKFTITFNGNGCGTPSKTSMEVTYGNTYGTMATMPAKTGYTTNVWYTAASGGSKITSTSKVTITSNKTYYAHCSINILYAKYDMNGGSLSSTHGSTVGTSGTLITVNGKDTFKLGEYGGTLGKDGLANCNNSKYINIVRTGYTAKSGAEWKYGSKEFNQATVYNVSDICNVSSSNCTATFKVNWQANSYKVQFIKNATDATGTMSNQSFTYGTEKALTSNKYSWPCHTFDSWNTKADGTGKKYTNGQKVKNLTSTKDGVVKLYAQWKVKTVKVTFMRNSTATDTTSATQTFTCGKTGQKFTDKGWTKTGHTQLGWSKDRGATDKTWTITNGVTDAWINSNSPSTTIFAVWKANSYDVKFQANGSIVKTVATVYNTNYHDFPSTPTRTGYTFGGWYTKTDCEGTKKTTSTKMTTAKNHTLYACWSAKQMTVKFQANSKIIKETTQTYGTNYKNFPANPTKTGFKFNGWYTETSCKGSKITSSTKVTKTSNHTLYACWDGNGWFDEDCKNYRENGVRVKGWKKIGSNWYYFDKSTGCLKTGWIKDNDSTCPSKYFYSNSSGVMQVGWLKYNNKWYYLAKANSDEMYWQSGKNHPLGCMLTGWVYDTTYSCRTHGWYFYSDGTLATSTTIESKYKVDSNGCWYQTWSDCASGDYWSGCDVWDDCATTQENCRTNCEREWNSNNCGSGGYWTSGKCCYDVCSSECQGGYVWNSYCTYHPCVGGWVAA
ncbi:MAG: InlB B-repeat-containing protein [Bacilli bacterium]|nr:InlB B-repeat-containing protein [Bacilli bacterium]